MFERKSAEESAAIDYLLWELAEMPDQALARRLASEVLTSAGCAGVYRDAWEERLPEILDRLS